MPKSKSQRHASIIILPALSLFLPILASIQNGSILELYKNGCILTINFIEAVIAFVIKDIENYCDIIYHNIYGLLRLIVYVHIASTLLSQLKLMEKIIAFYHSNTIISSCAKYISNIKALQKMPLDQIRSVMMPIYTSNKRLLLFISKCLVGIIKSIKDIFDDDNGEDYNILLQQALYNNSNHGHTGNEDKSICYICKEPSPKINTICCSIAVHVECMNLCLQSTHSSCVVCTSVLKLKYDGDRGCHAPTHQK